MSDELAAVLDDLHELGYETVDRVEGFESEASGRVPLPEEHRRERATGWRRYLPRIHCDAGDPDLVPDDLRAAVEARGWTVQAMGRSDDTVTVVVSENGV
ncbi:hypothetical protein [Halosimplex amylolyticum]|uniref:hypothetical protein n=1 Tax=Halosimplex amylolyticum TaxID=3396616 RepID=UPI003F55C144